MNRSEILATAETLISGDRQEQYGDARESFGLIAAYWSAHLDHPVTATDVAVMMTQVKLARMKASPALIDSYVDGCGYLALGGEMAG